MKFVIFLCVSVHFKFTTQDISAVFGLLFSVMYYLCTQLFPSSGAFPKYRPSTPSFLPALIAGTAAHDVCRFVPLA